MTESSSNGDLLNTDEVRCRYGIGRAVTSVNGESSILFLMNAILNYYTVLLIPVLYSVDIYKL